MKFRKGADYEAIHKSAALVVRDQFLTNTYDCNSRVALRAVLCTPTAYLKAGECT